MRTLDHHLLLRILLAPLLAVVLVLAPAQAATLLTPDVPDPNDLLAALVQEEAEAALAKAFFHTQSLNDRGTDVQAIQYLLVHRGYSIGVDGVFGSGTANAVKDFQSRNGLTADGIVGPATWGKLVVTVQEGSNNNAVKALQVQLNAKKAAGLAVDGVFGSGTKSKVVSFQNHMGITADGVVGPTTWKNLIWHYRQPVDTSNLCRITPYSETWGTAGAVGLLQHASNLFGGLGYGKLASNDISYEHGGDHPDHSTHEHGLDVDMRLIRTDKAQCSYGCDMSQSCYWRAGTQALCNKLREAAPGHVKAIYMNDQAIINSGCSSYSSGHSNHIHITYCEKGHGATSYYIC